MADDAPASAMICLFPSTDTAEQIATVGGPEGLTADDLHVTLVYLGDANSAVENIDTLRSLCEQFAMYNPPIQARVGGVGRFAATDENGLAPTVALIDGVELAAFHAALTDALDDAGIDYPAEHGFQPHMTLAYRPTDVGTDRLESWQLPDTPLTFRGLWLCVGEQRQEFPFGHDYQPIELPHSSDDIDLGNSLDTSEEGGGLDTTSIIDGLLNGGLLDDNERPVCAICALGPDDSPAHSNADLGDMLPSSTIQDLPPMLASMVLAITAAGVCTGPGPCVTSPLGTKRNWVTDAGGLPPYIRAIAHAMTRHGRSESQAIQVAVGVIKNWAHGSGKVSAATRARAAAALAQWEALKARGRVASASLPDDFAAFYLEFAADLDWPLTAAGVPAWAKGLNAGKVARGVAAPAVSTTTKTSKPSSGNGGGSSSSGSSGFNAKHPRTADGKFTNLGNGAGYNTQNEKGRKQNTRVRHVQWMLKHLGLQIGPTGVDGKLGPHTSRAIRSFQQSHGLRTTGVINKDTMNKLKDAAGNKAGHSKTVKLHLWHPKAQRIHTTVAQAAAKNTAQDQAGMRAFRQSLKDKIGPLVPWGTPMVSSAHPTIEALLNAVPVSVLLAAGEFKPVHGPSVGGLALKAADTGRVLMLQRGLGKEDDPAAGKWEFPGGHAEPDDPTSLHTGVREWQEEVGQPFPTGGVVAHTWQSPDGVYQGHVVVIPHESAVTLHQGRHIGNPDDPDGDESEQVAWWDPADAEVNPALRDECGTTPWGELKDAVMGGPDDQPEPERGDVDDPVYGNDVDDADDKSSTVVDEPVDKKVTLLAAFDPAEHRDHSGKWTDGAVGSLAKSLSYGVLHEEPASSHESTYPVKKVSLGDGTEAAIKRVGQVGEHDFTQSARAKSERDAEILTAHVAHTLGLHAPETERVGDHSIATRWVYGKHGYQFRAANGNAGVGKLARSGDGAKLAMMDSAIDNADRHDSNWMVGHDGHIIPMDHGQTFEAGSPGYARGQIGRVGQTGPFAKEFKTSQRIVPNPDHPGRETTGYGDNKLHPDDAKVILKKLASTRPEFEKSGRADWHDEMMRRAGEIAKHAKGTKRYLDENAIGIVSSADGASVTRTYHPHYGWIDPNLVTSDGGLSGG